jgi:hypothetical protein
MELDSDVGDFVLKILNMAVKHKSLFTKIENRYMQLTVEYIKIKSVKLSAGLSNIYSFVNLLF